MFSKLQNEFALKNFGFNDAQINDFVKSQWQLYTKNASFVVYRWFVAVVFIICITVSFTENNDTRAWKLWAIYLTNWALVINILNNIFAAILVTLRNYNVRFNHKMFPSRRVPIYIQIYWAFQSCAVTLALLITIVYWGFMHKYGTPIDATNVLNHIVNSVILIIDMFVIRNPHRIYHVIYVAILFIIFLIFSYIYYRAGGLNLKNENYIYPLLDWSDPEGTLLISFAALILILVLHFFVHGLYILRVFIYEKRVSQFSKSPSRLTISRHVSFFQ